MKSMRYLRLQGRETNFWLQKNFLEAPLPPSLYMLLPNDEEATNIIENDHVGKHIELPFQGPSPSPHIHGQTIWSMHSIMEAL